MANPFIYVKPTEDQTARMKSINEQIIVLWELTENLTTNSAERTIAQRKLQEFRMWINASIVFGE